MSIFLTEARLDGTDYGVFYSSAGNNVFSAERIQKIVAVFVSQPITLSDDITSWKDLSWSSSLPAGAKIYVYVRTAASETAIQSASWIGPLLDGSGTDISDSTGKTIQIKMVLYSSYSSGVVYSPVVSLLSASCYAKGTAETFYTTNLQLGFTPSDVLITYNGTIPENTILQFAVSTKNSVASKDYRVVPPNTVVNLEGMTTNSTMKISVYALGNTEVPFVVDEFAVAVGGNDFKRITPE